MIFFLPIGIELGRKDFSATRNNLRVASSALAPGKLFYSPKIKPIGRKKDWPR